MQTELHRHLDVSLRTSTLLRLAQDRGLEPTSTSIAAFEDKLVLRKPLSDLSSVLASFTICQQVLDRPDVLAQVASEVIEDVRAEGTRKIELRFSPTFVCELSHLAWDDALDGFEEGMNRALKKFPEMRAGLICIASRDYGVDAVEKTIDFYLKHRDRFVGLDLAGNEDKYPCRLFEKPFKKAIAAGAKITIHAGEAAGPENIWEAMEYLGASRIGHGITCVRDAELMRVLAEKKICLEMCPTSNWLTQAVPSLAEHPLPQVLRAGIPVCINTDDPTLFATTLPKESAICVNEMGLSAIEIEQCHAHADAASFCP